jgi:hypothetical protein
LREESGRKESEEKGREGAKITVCVLRRTYNVVPATGD